LPYAIQIYKIMYVLLVSEDFVQDPPDEEEKSMKRKYCFTTYIGI